MACGVRGPGFDYPPLHLNYRDWLYPASKSWYGWKPAIKATLILYTTDQPTIIEHYSKLYYMISICKRGSRGGTGGPEPPPPLRFVRGGVLCRGLMSTCRRGGPKVVFNLLLSFFFWLASLASIIQTYYINTYFQVQYSVWNGHPFSIFPLSKLWKESNFPSLVLWNGILVQNCTILHHLRQKFSGGGPPDPPPPWHTTLLNYHDVIYMFV